jgi:predicted Zn-dependent peptidase
MIAYNKFVLENGLRVIVHEDPSTPLVAVNVLYDVGSRDESPDMTGFAHLFEHLMFSGSENVQDFDDVVQRAGGDSNAFTNNDITNFYTILPAQNIETALYLESDRMNALKIDQHNLDVQKKVVVEEFKENCSNTPYGDAWHMVSELAYQRHSYAWPTIGKTIEHIQYAKLQDVQHFFKKHYSPCNAILVVSGNISIAKAKELVHKWFADIPRGEFYNRSLDQEPKQVSLKKKLTKANVPMDAIYMCFHVSDRKHVDYYATDLLSDIICNGKSSRLYATLLKEQKLFSYIDAYITGSSDPGLLVIEGKLSEDVDAELAIAEIWKEIDKIKSYPISQKELQKYKNKIESSLLFSESNIMNKAFNLAYFESIDAIDLINEELKIYEQIESADIQRIAQQVLVPENANILVYEKQTD